MPTMMTRHRVRDYDAWRKHFDEHEGKRREFGITSRRVYRNVADPNDLVLLFDVADQHRAQEFAATDDLRQIMEKAGVEMDTVNIKALPD